MKITLAPQSFKGSLSGDQVCEAYAEGVLKAFPKADIVKQPVGDGGDGTLDALLNNLNGKKSFMEASNALGHKQQTYWGNFPAQKLAYIEVANICGISTLNQNERNPFITTSVGVGECILEILNQGIKTIIIGLGGSATNDAGTGLLSALGIQFLSSANSPLPLGGGYLSDLTKIDASQLNPKLSSCMIRVACDVNNPLIGPEGATMIYSEQKGATEKMKDELEKALIHFSAVTKEANGMDISRLEYGGASGGIAAALSAYLGASLHPGIDLILEIMNFNQILEGADLVITGEGKMDSQTLYNKAPIGVARWAKKHHIPVIAVVGQCGKGYEQVLHHGINEVFAAADHEGSPHNRIVQATEHAMHSFIDTLHPK